MKKFMTQASAGSLLVAALVITAPDVNAQAAEAGAKLSNPLSDVWALFTEFDFTYSDGDFTDGHQSGQTMIFQPIMPFEFSENWKMITRPTVPFVFSTDIPDGRRWSTSPLSDDATTILEADGTATFDSKQGLGDISLPLLFSPKVPGRSWGWGLGPTFTFPTATTDELGHDAWEIGPAAVWTYHDPKWSLAVLGQYWWNYAESGSDTPDTSHGTILYSVWRNLPNAWQVGFNPTITYNDKTAGDDKWNVPVGLGIAKTVMMGKMPVKFQFSVEKSVVRQDDFGADWKIRFNVIPVIPSLQSKPFF
jgi:hypothetical protein